MEPGKPSASLAKLLPFILLFIPAAGVHLLVVPSLSDPGLYPKYILLCLYLLAFLLALVLQKREAVPVLWRIPLWQVFFAFVAVVGASVLWTRTPVEGLLQASRWWLTFLLFSLLVAYDFGKCQLRVWLPRLALSLLLGLSAFALWQLTTAILASGYDHSITYQVRATFAHRNLLSHALVLTLPMAFFLFYREKGAWRFAAGLGIGLGIAVTLLLMVRTSWVAAALSLLVFALLALVAVRDRSRMVRKLGLALVLGAGTAVAGWQIYQRAAPEPDLLQKHGAGLTGLHYGTLRERVLLWEKSLDLWQEKPLTGWGAGSWKVAVAGTGLGDVRPGIAQGETFVVRAHNDFLQLLTESGPLALGLFLLLLGMAFARVRLRAAGPEVGVWQASLLAGLAAYAVIALLSFPAERMAPQAFLAMYLAALVRAGGLPMGPRVKARTWIAGSLVLLSLLGCGWMGWARMRADLHLQEAMRARERGDQAAVVAALTDRDLCWAPLDGSTTPLAWYRGSAHLVRGDLPAALQDFQRAYQVHPHHPHVHSNFATAYVQKGMPDSARFHLREAVRLAPAFEEGWLNLAALEFNSGQVDAALAYLRNVPLDTRNPNYAGFRAAILSGKVQQMYLRHADHPVAPVLYRMRQDGNWLADLYTKAMKNELKFAQQVILDAVYTLENDEKSLTLDETTTLYNHYQLN